MLKIKKPVKEYYGHWFPEMVGAIAVTIGHNIFYGMEKEHVGAKLRYHEMVHVEQCERHGTVMFFLIYFKHYLEFRKQGLGHWAAYRRIPFEKEAHDREVEA